MSRTADREILLRAIPESGQVIGNITLLKQLGWEEPRYWRVRDELLNDGLLLRGKGKGGSVRRAPSEPGVPAVTKEAKRQMPEPRVPENSLYEPLLKVLSNEWVREMQIEPHQIHFELTANGGRKKSGGTWTRPDISAVSVRTFPHLPNKYMDVWTFEVKPVDCLDITAIFEATSHASRATRSYALLQVPAQQNDRVDEILERCDHEATRLRVGLTTFVDASQFATWETRVQAPRIETDPESLEEFIAQLSGQAKKRLAQWK